MRYPNYVSLLIILLYMVGCDDEKGSICSTPDQPRFSLQDLNPLSESFGETISPEFSSVINVVLLQEGHLCSLDDFN